MTTYRNGETVVRRVEFAVQAGSDIGTVNKVQHIAWMDYVQRTGNNIGSITSAPDDWCQVNVTDDEIVFAFTIEYEPSATDRAVKLARAATHDLAERAVFNRGQGPGGRLDKADLELIHHALNGVGVA